MKGVAASSLSHYIAALADLGTLLGSLESIQAKWYNFGLQLRVDVGQLDAIAAQYSNPLDCLRETLKQWLKTCPNCTWKCIVDALGNPIVGANALALELERKHCPQLDACASEAQAPHAQKQTFYSQAFTPTFHQGAQAANYPQPGYGSGLVSYSPFHPPTLRPTYTSNSTPVQFQPVYYPSMHTSQPPHIQPHASNFPSFNPQCREPPPAAKRPHFTHHITPLNPASPCTGSYTSQPQVGFSGASSVLFSTPPAVDRYAKYLREYYKSCGVVTEDTKWPPTPTVRYINLAYISRSNVTRHEVEEFTRAAVLGKIEDIVRVKKPLSFEEVASKLPNGSLPRIVLVEGAPGVGKTTFVWEACRRWGNGEILQQYSLVVVLRLRDKRIREANVFSDLFYHSNKALLQSVVQEIENNLGENLLLILEGLDELPEELREQPSIFLDLMHGRLLPKATILVTTRPWASVYLHEHCSHRIHQHIEILGFTKEQVDCYLKSVLGSNSETMDDINKYLTRYPQIHAAMTIPLNAAIVVCVYNENRTGKCVLPQTMTELYTALAKTLLLRYVREHPTHDKKERLHNFIDLLVPPDVSANFHQLTKVAYDGIKNGQQLIFSDLPRDFETLDFMQATPELYVSEGVHVSHNFLHLTIQEYLAAAYITQLSPEVMLKHFRHCANCANKWSGNSGVFEVVMMFVAGLTKFSGIPSNSIRRLFGKPKYCNVDDPITQYLVKCDYTLTLDHVKWLYETQSSNTINAIFGNVNTIEFEVFGLMPFHYYCLGYCIAHSHCQWKLVFNDEITMENVEMLNEGGSVLHISNHDTSIIVGITLRFEPDTMPPDKLLASLFHTLSLHFRVNLQELIEDYYLCGSCLRVVIGNWRLLQSLKVLRLMRITVDDFRKLCELLASTSKLNGLEIIKTRYNLEDYELSYVTVEGTYQHTSVSLDIVMFSEDDITGTASVLTENSKLGLHFTAIRMWRPDPCEGIYDDQGCQLVRALHDSTLLKTFKLVDHPIGTTGAMAVAKLLHSNKSLEEVDISKCFIDSEGVCHVAQALCENTTLRKLDLSDNPFGKRGVMALAKLIHTNKSLEEMNISKCFIDSEGVYHLAQALCENTTLRKLDLSDNPFGKRGVMALAKLIHTNKSLEEVKVIDSRIDMFGSWEACENTAVKKLDHTQLIHSNKSMHKVDISSCFIDNEGACHLAQALCENTTLQKMDLSGIPIGQERSVEEGIHKLLEATTVNSTLRELRLSKGCEEYTKSFPRFSEVRCRVMIRKDWY